MELDLERFSNLLEEVKLTSKEIEIQIKPYNLTFDQYKNKYIEWEMKLPMFIHSFYPYILANQSIPTQNEFYEFYINSNNLQSQIINLDLERGLKARIYRTYPSLVRDIHFSILLKEKSRNSKVIYNMELDVVYGIDILIEFKKELYALNLFTPTKRAYIGRNKKKYRHKEISNIIGIELPVEFNNKSKHGNFFLYNENQIEQIKNQFKKILK